MGEVLVSGVWVPSAISAHFKNAKYAPFSYTKPNLRFIPGLQRERTAEKKEKRVGPPNYQRFIYKHFFLRNILSKKEKLNGLFEQRSLLLTSRGMAQPVHLQYNSPMPIYSKSAAEEQYQQQIGDAATPIPLPLGDKHFDPEKSATLKYIKEGDEGHFGEHLFEHIAEAEAPRPVAKEEPEWARYARAKSERARSRTPADPSQHHTPSMTPIPHSHQHERSRADSPREFIEKTRTYTDSTQPRYYGPAYYQTQSHSRRRGYSEPRDAPGYELGGLDYTKGLNFPAAPYDYTYEIRSRSTNRDQNRPRSGYELGGVSYSKGYVAPGPYHGHGPDPPRLRSRYSADPRSPCNTYYAPNVDEVDANLLVGDTISNQKIRHEVRHIDQSEFGTSFAPPTGFKRDHMTVKRSPAPPEPVTFSLSANKARLSGGTASNYSHQQHEQHRDDMWRQRNGHDGSAEKEVTVKTLLTDEALRRVERETAPAWRDRSLSKQEAWKYRSDPRLDRDQVFTTEPNWSRTVQQRRNAWERMAYDTDARVSLPASAKVPAPQPPAWHNKAARTHNVWQQAADTMSHGMTQSYIQQPQQSYETSQTSYHQTSSPQPYQSQYPGERHSQYSSSQHQEEQHRQQQQQQSQQYTSTAPPSQYHTSSHHDERHQSAPPQQTYNGTGGNNAELQMNTGYNANQIDYVKDHYDKYRAGPTYAASQQQYEEMNKSSYNKSYSSSTQQQNVGQQQSAIPLPAPTQSYSYSTETRTSTQGAPVTSSLQQQYSQQQSSHMNDTSSAIPIQPAKTSYEESSYHRSESSKQETSRAIPVQTAANAQTQTVQVISTPKSKSDIVEQLRARRSSAQHSESYNKSYTSSTAHSVPVTVQPAQNYTASSYTETHSTQPPMVMHSPGGSYKSYSSSHYSKQEKTTSTTTNQPAAVVTQTTNLPITKSTAYNYQQQSVPSAQPPMEFSQSSFTSHTEKSTTENAPQPIAMPAPAAHSNYQAQLRSHREETRREETSRPVSQLSQYSEQKSYKRNMEEKTETRTIPAATSVYTSDANRNFTAQDVFNKREEMNETLPLGSISNTHANTQGEYRDQQGHDVSYKRETQTAVDPGKEYALLKEEEKRVVETDLEPGVISRHVTTKYYKKKTVTDTTTTTTPQ